MATKITAYLSADGKIYETQSEAEKAELNSAVEYLAEIDKDHLMSVVTGHSTNQKTRDAILLIASRLPALCLPIEDEPR